MSHITSVSGTVTFKLEDLPFLAQAIEHFCPDLEIVKGESHYRTWKDDHNGKLVGDWPLPEGWTEAGVGENAAHVIRVKDEFLKKKNKKRNDHGAPYEIGIVPVAITRDKEGNVTKAVPDKNSEEYMLMTDWYNNGAGILNCEGVGRRMNAPHPQTGKKVEMSFGDLYMHYRMMQAKHVAEQQGDTMNFTKLDDGTYVGQIDTSQRIHLTG